MLTLNCVLVTVTSYVLQTHEVEQLRFDVQGGNFGKRIMSKVTVSTVITMSKFYTNFRLGTFKQSQQCFVCKKILHIPLQHRQTQKLEAMKIVSCLLD